MSASTRLLKSKVLMYKFMSTSSTLVNSSALIDLLLVLIIILPIFKQNLLDDILLVSFCSAA